MLYFDASVNAKANSFENLLDPFLKRTRIPYLWQRRSLLVLVTAATRDHNLRVRSSFLALSSLNFNHKHHEYPQPQVSKVTPS
jgi:hypothetical protein